MFATIDGDLWPAADKSCRKAAVSQFHDMDLAIEHCRHKRIAVQAGGNCGIWPRYLAEKFQVVYTFEPDSDNFHCLTRNAPQRNIIKIQAALGDIHSPSSMRLDPDNVGAHRMDISLGIIPILALDAFRLKACDFIQLDIEGFEPFALKGAEKTIKAFRPVIMIEQKGKEKLYGFEENAGEKLLAEWGYQRKKAIRRDVILVHA